VSGDPLDMTGLWHGTYSYVGYAQETMPFAANFVDDGGHLSGSIIEPASGEEAFYGEEIEARVAGARGDRSVDFTKTYTGQVWTHSVDYVGQLSPDGQTVTGMWSVDSLDGTFEMHRDLKLEELAEQEEAVEEPVTGGAVLPGGLPEP
jgi:hypothetical protein